MFWKLVLITSMGGVYLPDTSHLTFNDEKACEIVKNEIETNEHKLVNAYCIRQGVKS